MNKLCKQKRETHLFFFRFINLSYFFLEVLFTNKKEKKKNSIAGRDDVSCGALPGVRLVTANAARPSCAPGTGQSRQARRAQVKASL